MAEFGGVSRKWTVLKNDKSNCLSLLEYGDTSRLCKHGTREIIIVAAIRDTKTYLFAFSSLSDFSERLYEICLRDHGPCGDIPMWIGV